MDTNPLDNIDSSSDELLARYLSNECSAGERAEFESWVSADPAHRAALDAGRAAWEQSAPTAPLDAAAFVARVEAAVLQEQRRQRSASRVSFTADARRTWRRFVPVAALSACVALALWSASSLTSRFNAPTHRTYTTARGQEALVTLADGSRIRLAPASRLRVADRFGAATSRTVELVGEAYFDVVVSHGAPFIVKTGAVATRVLGTAFNVRRYENEPSVRVAVVSGKVSIAANQRIATLTAGTIAHATDSTVSVVPVRDLTPYTGWTHGRLEFDDTPVSQILETVGRWYGYEFRLADTSIATQRMTATFKVTASQETMADLARLLRVTMTVDGNTVTLHPRRSGANAPTRRDVRNAFSPSLERGR